MSVELPKPTEEELKPYNKVDYIIRLLSVDYHKKMGISHTLLVDWLSDNYNSWYLYGRGIKINK